MTYDNTQRADELATRLTRSLSKYLDIISQAPMAEWPALVREMHDDIQDLEELVSPAAPISPVAAHMARGVLRRAKALVACHEQA